MTADSSCDPFAVDNPRALDALTFAWETSTTRSGSTAVNGALTTTTTRTTRTYSRATPPMS